MASPELHVFPRGLTVGSVPLKPQTLRRGQFPPRKMEELLLEEGGTNAERVKPQSAPHHQLPVLRALEESTPGANNIKAVKVKIGAVC